MTSIRNTIAAVLVALGALGTAVYAAGREGSAETAEGNPDLAKYSTDDLQNRARQMVDAMEEALAESFKLLEASISQGNLDAEDVRSGAITQMKGLVKLAEGYLVSLQQAAAEKNRATVENESVKIAIAASKVNELFAQVRSAGGVDGEVDELSDVVRDTQFLGQLPFDLRLAEGFFGDIDLVVPEEPIRASPYF